jgi:hypothetical protein
MRKNPGSLARIRRDEGRQGRRPFIVSPSGGLFRACQFRQARFEARLKAELQTVCRATVFVLAPLCLSVLACFLFVQGQDRQAENVLVLSDQAKGRWIKFSGTADCLYHHLASEIFAHLEQRTVRVNALHNADQWCLRQAEIRETLAQLIGPFPPRTPLNARVVGTVQKAGYRIEKVVLESQPRFYLTACLFLPAGFAAKKPALLFCSGHSPDAFRLPAYQKVILNLIRKGFIVMAFDPIGQGERLQYLDPETKKALFPGPGAEHSYVGAQCFIAGDSLARYMIWDGIRCLDYLVSRDEVDAARIGCLGQSGGGTQSTYIAAFDERVAAVAPSSYITNFRRLFESVGAQDAEQNFPGGIAAGIDQGDLLMVRAPKPALILATSRDFFSIQGARETFQEVRRGYAALGLPDHIRFSEDDYGHGYTEKNRKAMYAFFQRHLGLPGPSSDDEIEELSPDELKVTQTGQVLSSLAGETVFTLNRRRSEQLCNKLYQSRDRDLESHLSQAVEAARRIAGYQGRADLETPVYTGRYSREGYHVEKHFLPGDDARYPIPFLMLVPDDGPRHPAVIYLHPEGKAADAAPGGAMEQLVKHGLAVVAPDLAGMGEIGAGTFQRLSLGKVSYSLWFQGIQIGRSIVGIRAGT